MKQALSRLGIFVFFDPHGIVDDYVIHLLRAFRPHFQRLVVVSNSKLEPAAQERLLSCADDLLIRENRGLDASAYKAGMLSYCGWDEVCKYDEVILINDTFFGPILSFDEMFSEMAERDLDFWGMSAAYHMPDWWKRVKYKYIPSHIQTFFIAFRKHMVNTEAFRSYWENYDDSLDDFISVVTQNEVVLTKHFQDLGFRWDVYADTRSYNAKSPYENFVLYQYHPNTMISQMHFPVLKKKALNVNFYDQYAMQDMEAASDALAYIHSQTEYDTAMIWDSVLRLYNIADLYDSLHLNYILPSAQADIPENSQIALVYRLSNPLFTEQFCNHALQMCNTAHVYMIPESDHLKDAVLQKLSGASQITVLDRSGQQTEMGCFLIRCRDLAAKYDYLGYIHDAGDIAHIPPTVIESEVYGYLQNVANDPAYVSQVLHCFETNPKLGILGVPFPIHGPGFVNYGNMWNNCYPTIQTLSRELELNCNISEEKPSFVTVGSFWCRTTAIQSLWNKEWKPRHFILNAVTRRSITNDALIRLLPYAAQSAQYYSGIVMHTNYASMRIASQQHMLNQIISITGKQLGCNASRYQQYIEQLQSISIQDKENSNSLMIDLANFTPLKIIQIYLERNTPPWFSALARRILSSLKSVRINLHNKRH